MKKSAVITISILCLAIASGCGGKKKEDKNTAKAQGVSISGRVDVFSGYGIEADGAGLSAKLNSGTMVKLYKFTGKGTELKAVSGITPKPIDRTGDFSVENVPSGEANLVVSVETPSGGKILSAIVPYVSGGGVRGVIVSPESNLEVEVFKEVLLQMNKRSGKVSPSQIDSSLVKIVVTPDIFFLKDTQKIADTTAGVIAAAVVEAESQYAEAIAGNGRPITDPNVQTVLKIIREPEMNSVLAGERADLGQVFPEAVSKDAADRRLADAMREAVRKVNLIQSDMSEEGILHVAMMKRAATAVACLYEGAPARCRENVSGTVKLGNYPEILRKRFAESYTTDEMTGRISDLIAEAMSKPAAADDRPAPASGSAPVNPDMPPVVTAEHNAPLRNGAMTELANLLAVSDEGKAATKDILSVSSQEGSGPAAFDYEAALQRARDFAMVGWLDLDYSTVKSIEDSLRTKSKPLLEVISKSDSGVRDIADARKTFGASLNDVFEPLLTQINSRYEKLPENERNKIYVAAREVFLSGSLFDVPSALFHNRDSDEDGAPNDVEAILGTNPEKADSKPAVVTASSPESLVQMADADADGYPDVIEKMQGTDAVSASSKPEPAALVFCSGNKFPCAARDKKEKADEIAISGEITFKGKAAAGVLVALYKSPKFTGAEPAYVSAAVSDAGGNFTVKAAKGIYYVASFVDVNGDGKPGSGDSVGYYGDQYLYRVSVTADTKLDGGVSMHGRIGGSKCEAGQYVDAASGECMKQCGAGLEPDELTGMCRCAAGKKFSLVSSACVDTCPEGTVSEKSGMLCGCPKGASFDSINKSCVCGAGMSLDAAAGSCKCDSGYLNPANGSCAKSCPPTMTGNDSAGKCECPADTKLSESTGMCECEGGKYHDTITHTCVSECPQGTTLDPHKRACVCPRNEVPDGSGSCACDEGFTRDEKSGKCEMPCPEGTSRNEKGECEAPKDKEKTST